MFKRVFILERLIADFEIEPLPRDIEIRPHIRYLYSFMAKLEVSSLK